MPKISVNPNAKAPDFVAVAPGDYQMTFQRFPEKHSGQSDKGNWWARLKLVHTAPSSSLLSLKSGLPLKADELPGSVSAVFMLDDRGQGKVRQAFEAAGLAWPTEADAPTFESELEYAEWIQQNLENKVAVVCLSTKLNKERGTWDNEVAKYVTE